MIEVVCRTNLDLSNETWPDKMPAVPNVGDHIQSATDHGGFRLELQVVRVTWKQKCRYSDTYGPSDWVAHIELHMTDFQRRMPPKDNHSGSVADGSITAFYQWYAPLVGRSVGAFI